MNYTVKELIQNEVFFTENLVQIADKSRKVVPFTRQAIQRKFDDDETGRDIVVKPAQVGFSSRIIAKILHRTITIPNTTSVIIAYEDFITQRLLSKAQAFYDSLPKEFKPEMDRRGTHEKYFADINSVLYIGSARSYTFARGEAIHNFMADEYGFWPDPTKIMGPALDRVVKPHEGGRFWVISTPNGENAFYDMYMQAKEGKEVGGSPFTPHFYPWFMHEEYRLEVGHPDALEKDMGELVDLDSDEHNLMELGVDEEQLRWRRLKIAEKEILTRSGETRVLFSQEYPSDDVTCFLAAGDMVYDADLLTEKAKKCREPFAKDNGLYIWEAPKQNEVYHISVDPGQGKQTKSVVQVWRFWWETDGNGKESEHGKLCASWSELADITPTARLAERAGQMYGNPKMAPEANGHGLGFIHETTYNNLYMRKDIVSGREMMVPGWYTSPHRTKPAMIKELKKMLPNLEILDLRVISELRNIIESPEKKDIYISIGADDNHDAACIAVITRDSRPVEYEMAAYGW